jgi:hypothetical protein
MPQTAINSRQVQWLGEGQYATTRNRSVDGAVMQAVAAAFIAYGRVAVLDPATNLVSPLSGAPAAGLILVVPILVDRYGVALNTALQSDPGDLGYPQGSMVEYITQGDIVMWSENGGTLGGDVHFRHTAAAAPNNKVGRVRNAADGSNTATKNTMKFAETKTTAGLIAVRIMTSVSL